MYKATSRGSITPFITIVGAHLIYLVSVQMIENKLNIMNTLTISPYCWNFHAPIIEEQTNDGAFLFQLPLLAHQKQLHHHQPKNIILFHHLSPLLFCMSHLPTSQHFSSRSWKVPRAFSTDWRASSSSRKIVGSPKSSRVKKQSRTCQDRKTVTILE